MHLLKNVGLYKHGVPLGLAFTVTVTLVLLMQHLIEADQDGLNEAPQGHILNIEPVIEDRAPVIERRKVEVPPPPIAPPDTKIPPLVEQTGGEWDFRNPLPEVPEALGPGHALGVADGDLLPIVKVRPRYPQRALKRGIEGYVLIRFTVDEFGRVVDPVIIEAEPVGVFDRSAMEAVRRFKYRPRVLCGQPMSVNGVKHRLSFELSS